MAWYKIEYEIINCRTGVCLRSATEVVEKPWWKLWANVEKDLHYIGVGALSTFEPGTIIVTEIKVLRKMRLNNRLNYPRLRGA